MIQVNCSVQLRKHACSIHPLPDPVNVCLSQRGGNDKSARAPSLPSSLLHMYGVCELLPLLVSRPLDWHGGGVTVSAQPRPTPSL